MKRTLVTATSLLLAGGVHAQSGVNVYGLIDISVNHARFDSVPGRPSSLWALSNDASRLGFRGSEDLGSGLRAYFKLETGVSFDTGTQTSATQFWNRETYVGLADARFGSLQFGSQYTPAVWATGKVDPFARFGVGANVGLHQGSPRGFAFMFDNAVQYITPVAGGFAGRLMISAGEGAVVGRSVGGSVEFTRGPFYAVATYDRPHVAAASVGLTGGPVASGTMAAGATYDFGMAKVAGWYQHNRIDGLPSVDGYMVGLTVPARSGEFRAAYTHRKQLRADASQIGIGYHHFLSKRTTLYAHVGQIDNTGTAAFGLGPSRTEQGAAGLLAAGRDGKVLQLGVRHTF